MTGLARERKRLTVCSSGSDSIELNLRFDISVVIYIEYECVSSFSVFLLDLCERSFSCGRFDFDDTSGFAIFVKDSESRGIIASVLVGMMFESVLNLWPSAISIFYATREK
jgi:hypothetical protein